jgi:malonate-semialdehyde dehydrogenase (acetylating)/methylmalonate-semialdehyde dehydrogenase
MTRNVEHFFNNKHVASSSGRFSPIYDPSTGTVQAEVGLASVEEVDMAVAAAREAFQSWRAVSLSRRSEIMFAFRHLLHEQRDEIAALVSSEHGKVASDAAGELARGIENVEFACGIAQLLKGEYSEQVSTGVDVYSFRQPLGVVAGITPFNFPCMVPLWMLANAIACGNTFVLKPSEKDPSTSVLLGELLAEAGLPDGVFNVVHGDKVAVDRILEHPHVAAVSFVGSTPIAHSIYERGTASGKRVQALGGAKNHMVVLPDSDLDVAADAAVSAAYGSAGERCMAISVVVAVGGIAEPLVDAIASRLPTLRIGPGSDPAAEMGPLVTAEHRDKVASYLDAAVEEGATVRVDGRRPTLLPGADPHGFFLGASLVDDVQPGMRVYDDEVFGPVLSVIHAADLGEALRIVNANPFGNGTAIFTRDGAAVRRFQNEVECGMVGVNVPIPVPVSFYSFGGWKNSLFGDVHMYGPAGVEFYTKVKVVTSRWPKQSASMIDLGFPSTR